MNCSKNLKRILTVFLAVIMAFCAFPFIAGAANTSDNAKEIFIFLVNEMDLNHAAASGVLANIECESDFNHHLYGDSGTSYGICQWHAGRFDNLKKFCKKNGYSWESLEGQLQYLKHELTTQKSDTGYILDRLDVPNTAEGAYTAAYNWCYYFERPANKEVKSENRGNLAKNDYWPEYKSFNTTPDIPDSPILPDVKPDNNTYGKGDVNGDGKINSADALLILEYSVGFSNLTRKQVEAADLSGNGIVTSEDALVVLSIASGKDSIENYK